MIKNRQDYKEYVAADVAHSYVPQKSFLRFLYALHGNEQCNAFRYVKCLREYEYHLNTGHRIRAAWYHFRLSRLGLRFGLRINPNCVGKGLNIIHIASGGVILNCKSAGDFLRLQAGVVVGVVNTAQNSPIIGNYVSFGLGSKAFGKIQIGDFAKILPNAVVTHDVPEGAIVGGVPARFIRYQTEEEINEIKNRTNIKT